MGKLSNEPFVIYGNISGATSKRGLSGLKVVAYDKDLIKDDRLGEAETNSEGDFEITFTQADFQDTFFETRPEVYLQVYNRYGNLIHTTKALQYGDNVAGQVNVVLKENLTRRILVDNERSHFKTLLSINPNYFGTAVGEWAQKYLPVFPLNQHTKYEELTCVGLAPDSDELEAVLKVKLPYGFGGKLCDKGGEAWVGFYLDYDDGFGWKNEGTASVNLHDLASVAAGPVYYAVKKHFTPKYIKRCENPQVIKVRAILSWGNAPTGPAFVPVWGNVLETYIQLRPKRKFNIPFSEVFTGGIYTSSPSSFLFDSSLPPDPVVPEPMFTLSGSAVQIKEQIDLHLKESAHVQEGVEDERHNFLPLIYKNANHFGNLSEEQKPDLIQQDLLKLSPAIYSKLQAFSPGFGAYLPVNPGYFYKTSYEELKCVGLYPEADLLEAVLDVKKTSGYSGSLCALGSREYVGFWIDWGDGLGYTYAGTSSVVVHDINTPNKPVSYAVQLLIPDISERLKTCKTENIVKVRAILSWNVDPTPYGPAYRPVWGNVRDARVQIRTKTGVVVRPRIGSVNEVQTTFIDALGYENGTNPFGGTIGVDGYVNVPGAVYYRVRYRKLSGGFDSGNVVDPRYTADPTLTAFQVPPVDADGWFSIADLLWDLNPGNPFYYPDSKLSYWNSGNREGLYRLTLELADGTKAVLPGLTSEVDIHLDNKNVTLHPFLGAPASLPSLGVTVKTGTGDFKRCGDFVGTETIEIWGNFTDEHYSGFSLEVFGGNISGNYPVAPLAVLPVDAYGIIGTSYLSDPGDIGYLPTPGRKIAELDLSTVPQSPAQADCAYGIRLVASDHTRVGYVSGYGFRVEGHSNENTVTFNWKLK